MTDVLVYRERVELQDFCDLMWSMELHQLILCFSIFYFIFVIIATTDVLTNQSSFEIKGILSVVALDFFRLCREKLLRLKAVAYGTKVRGISITN